MLDSMRSLSKSIVSKILMILLVISFAVWGVGDILTNNGPTYAARVGGERIGINEFQQQRSLVARQLQSLGMKDLPQGQLEASVIRQLVQQKLSLMAMQDMGLVVNDELISKLIADMFEFKGKDGKFDGKKFKSMLDAQRLSEKAFIAQLKRDVAGKFLADSLDMRDALAPTSVVGLQSMIQGETRDAVLLTIPASTPAKPDEAALKSFYEENKTLSYLRPEQRVLDYVVLTKADIDGLTTNKAGEKTSREEALHQFGNDVEDALAAGKTMGEAFKAAGIVATIHTLNNATAETAKTSNDDIIKTVAEQGFGLGEGEISRLISSNAGAMLMVSAKKIIPAEPKPFEEVKADIETRLSKQLARDAARSKAVQAKAELAKSPSWEAVAQNHGLSSRAVSRVGRPSDTSSAVDGVPVALQNAIFERNVGEVAGPLTLPNGDQVLALVTKARLPENRSEDVSSKEMERMGEMLGQYVQTRAYEYFTKTHKVEVNPAIMRQQAAE